MTASLRIGPDDLPSSEHAARPEPYRAKWNTPVRCSLCRETIDVVSNYRPTTIECPRCGMHFAFDPEQSPLPVRGLRLRFSEVLKAQRGPSSSAKPDSLTEPVRNTRRFVALKIALGAMVVTALVAVAMIYQAHAQ